MTKLVTWNCNMAFRKKKEQVLEYDPDILVVQECENPAISGDWSEFSDWHWIGDNEHKGLGVFLRHGLALDSVDDGGQDCRYVLPVRIEGSLDVLGVWAMNDEADPKRRYIGQVYTALRPLQDFLDSRTIVAGDFNWNVMWDESPASPLYGDFTDTVEILNEIGLCSSYHCVTGSDFGDENDSTFFMHKRDSRGYHIDYVFVPSGIRDSIDDCSIGSYDEWIDASDHMPVMIEFDES